MPRQNVNGGTGANGVAEPLGSSLHLTGIPSEYYQFWNTMMQRVGAGAVYAHEGNMIVHFPHARNGIIFADVIRRRVPAVQVVSTISESGQQYYNRGMRTVIAADPEQWLDFVRNFNMP